MIQSILGLLSRKILSCPDLLLMLLDFEFIFLLILYEVYDMLHFFLIHTLMCLVKDLKHQDKIASLLINRVEGHRCFVPFYETSLLICSRDVFRRKFLFNHVSKLNGKK